MPILETRRPEPSTSVMRAHRYGAAHSHRVALRCGYVSGVRLLFAVGMKPSGGLKAWGFSRIGRYPAHSYGPSPGTGTTPLQLERMGAMPTACQPMLPLTSAHTMFSPGMLLKLHAARNSSQLRA